jgi:predicted PurR-regulated permease PerM
MNTPALSKSVKILFLFFLAIGALVIAKPFLVPLTFAGLLSMLFLPLCARMERKGWHRGLAAVLCLLLFVAALAGIIALLGWQLSGLAEDISKAKGNITGQLNKLKEYISNTLGVSQQQQQELMKKQQSSAGGGAGKAVAAILSGIGGVLANTLLVLVYTFLLLYFRTRIKEFVLKLTPTDERYKAKKIMQDSRQVSQKYLTGMAMMIGCLWVLYGIGFSIVGVKHALFFAMLCGILEIIPFVGNLTGTALTVLMAFTQGGGTSMVLGVVAVYAVVQFVQTYLLEPLVVGSEVNINPLFTIMGLVLGELIWGIPGMILAIPIMGITKIICDNIEPLKPFGFLLGEDKKEKGNSGFLDKIKGLFSKS